MSQRLFISRMILRELRTEFRLLLAVLLPVMVGVALIVSLGMLRSEIINGLSAQQEDILGADIKVSFRGRVEEDLQSILAEIPGERVREVSFPSMLLHAATGNSRLVQVRGIDNRFPLYGNLEVEPTQAKHSYMNGKSVLLELGAAQQLEASIGDTVRLGEKNFTIAGIFSRIPGGNEMRSSIVPSVYVLEASLKEAGLMELGLRQRTTHYFLLPKEVNRRTVSDRLKNRIERIGGSITTPEANQARFGGTIDSVYQYLNLFGIAALLFGVVGAAAGGMQYARSKRRVTAVLKCIGAKPASLIIVYCGTLLVASFLASVGGVLLSWPLLTLFIQSFSQFLPIADFTAAMPSALVAILGVVTGCFFSLAFALPPILSLRRVTAMEVLREESEQKASGDGIGLGLIVTIIAAAFAGSNLLGGNAKLSSMFALGLAALIVAQVVVVLVTRKLVKMCKRIAVWFPLRHGINSLGRPGSETMFLCVLIGLPFFIVVSLWSTSTSLSEELESILTQNQENVVFFDVQPNQREVVERIAAENKVKTLGYYPLVSMRLSSIRGTAIESLREKSKNERDTWFLSREYRNTFRDRLLPNETMVEGSFIPSFTGGLEEPVPVTLEESMAERLGLKVNDRVSFNVQGLEIKTSISGIRKFNWRSVNPGFFVVFPKGVLEEAPHVAVITARSDSQEAVSNLQRQVALEAPNVSLVDSRNILETLSAVFSRLKAVVGVVAFATLASAILVFFSTLYLSRGSRREEFRVFHRLGAARHTISLIAILEFTIIGIISCSGAAVVATVLSYFTNKYTFKIDSLPPLHVPSLAMIATIFLLALIAWIQSRRLNY